MKPGKGSVTINKKDANDYFTTSVLQYKINQPFMLTETAGQYDVQVNVDGGGITGQAEAVRLAISKALIEVNPEWKPTLKQVGLTTRAGLGGPLDPLRQALAETQVGACAADGGHGERLRALSPLR
jgi:ribosomal protein S9